MAVGGAKNVSSHERTEQKADQKQNDVSHLKVCWMVNSSAKQVVAHC